jgi:hypothetical protein
VYVDDSRGSIGLATVAMATAASVVEIGHRSVLGSTVAAAGLATVAGLWGREERHRDPGERGVRLSEVRP